VEGRAVTLEILGTNEQEIAYLAGIFDGEGCISTASNYRLPITSRSLQLGIGMTTAEPLYLCSSIFGGKIRQRQETSRKKVLFYWYLYGHRAETFLRVVQPYLTVKRDKAALALSFIACGHGNTPRKLELAELITPHQAKNHDVNPDE